MLPCELNRHKVGILPLDKSRIDKSRFPVKMLEYASCGLAVVADNVGEAGNFLKNPLVVFTSALIHADIFHLVFNMAALFFLGNAFEINFGSKSMVVLFILSASASCFFFWMFFPFSSAVGISGFIYGLIGCLMVLKPSLKILLPLGFVSIPAPVIIAGPVIGFIEFIFSSTVADGIAHSAHLGGFIAGFVFGIYRRL